MEFKGTKGKWKIKRWGSNGLLSEKEAYAIDSDCWAVCAVWKDIDDVEPMANAKLIVSAPLMLKDLTDLIWLVERGASKEEINERIMCSKKTIKKALK